MGRYVKMDDIIESHKKNGIEMLSQKNHYGITFIREIQDNNHIIVEFNDSMIFSRKDLDDFYKCVKSFFKAKAKDKKLSVNNIDLAELDIGWEDMESSDGYI